MQDHNKQPDSSTHKRGPKGRRLIWLLRALLLVILLIVVGIWILLQPSTLKKITEKVIADATGGQIQIKHAAFDLGQLQLKLEDVHLLVPGPLLENSGVPKDLLIEGGRLLKLPHTEITFKLWPIRASRVLLDEPEIFITEILPPQDAPQANENTSDADWTFEHLPATQTQAKPKTQKPTSTKRLPDIIVNRGIIHRQQIQSHDDDSQITELSQLLVGGQFSHTANSSQLTTQHPTYHIALMAQAITEPNGTPEASSQPTATPRTTNNNNNNNNNNAELLLTGELDLTNRSLQIVLPRFVYNQTAAPFLPQALRHFHDLYEPAGQLRSLTLQVAAEQANQPAEFQAVFEIEDGQITLPYGQNNTPNTIQPTTTRMTQVAGRIKVNSQGVGVENLSGKVAGITYQLNGQVDNLTADAPFRVDLETQPFTLGPKLEENIFALPDIPAARELYEQFSPSGQFKAHITAQRTTDDPQIKLTGHIDVLNATMQHIQLPYPAKNVTGSIGFSNNTLTFTNLAGLGPQGNPMNMNGSIVFAEGGPMMKLRIAAEDLPVDDILLNSLPKATQHGLDLAVSPTKAKSLQTKLNTLTQQKSSDELTAPAWTLPQLKGQIAKRVEVMFDRTAGAGKKMKLHIHINAAGLPLLPEAFSYPAIIDSGWVTYQRGVIIGHDIQIRPIDLNVKTNHEQIGSQTNHLKLQNSNFAPQLQTKLSGVIISRATTHSPVLDYALTHLTLPGNRHNLVAEKPGRQAGKGVLTYLLLHPTQVPIDHWLTWSLPENAAESLTPHQVQGVFTGQIAYHPVEDDAQVFNPKQSPTWTYQITGNLDNGQAKPFGTPYPLTNLQTTIQINPDQITLAPITGQWENAQAQAQLVIHTTNTPSVEGEIQLKQAPLNRKLITLLPPEIEAKSIIEREFEKTKLDGQATILTKFNTNPNHNTNPKFKPNSTPTTLIHQIDSKPSFKTTIYPHQAQAELNQHSLTLDHISGYLEIDHQGAQLHQLTAQIPEGDFTLNGSINSFTESTTSNQTPDFDLRVQTQLNIPSKLTKLDSATNTIQPTSLSSSLWALWPDALCEKLESLGFKGQIQTNDTQIKHENQCLVIQGPIAVSDAQLKTKINITETNFTANTVIKQAYLNSNQKNPPTVITQIVDGQAKIEGRFVTNLSIKAHTDPQQPKRILFTDIQGLCYGGTLTGNAYVDVDDTPDFGFKTQLFRAELGPLLNLDQRKEAESKPYFSRSIDSGLFSLNLSVSGQLGDLQASSGTGHFRITHAKLMQKPLAMTVLSAMNFATPTQDAFNEAEGQFTVQGNTILLDEARLHAPQIDLFVNGKMTLPECGLDMEIASRNNQMKNASALGYSIRNQFLSLKLLGTYDNPRVVPIPLPGLWQTIDDTINPKPLTDSQ